MTHLSEPEEMASNFLRGFKDSEENIKYEKRISEIIVNKSKSLKIDLKDIYDFKPTLGRDILENPDNYIEPFQRNAFSILRIRAPEYADHIKKLNVRFTDLPVETDLRKIGAEHVGKLIMTSGIIVKGTPVTPYVLTAIFKCMSCNAEIKIPQIDQNLQTPEKCFECQGRKNFKILSNKSEYVNSQRITIQERPEQLPSGQLPRQLSIEVRDDLVDIARPGDRITVIGTLDLIRNQTRGGTSRNFQFTFIANSLELIDRELELELTPEDELQIRQISEDPWVFRRILQSIAPSIYGLQDIKESILYLLFGGVTKELTDMRIRGDLNVLLLGDPGTGKSQLLQFTGKTALRGILTTGRGSSAAGLTAAVVKEGGTGSYILEAGALVLGDKGVCCIDEMDKMRDEDRGAIHPAMEQQTVSIAKGGIVATLNARTSILAAANPTLGRYNPYQSIRQNINLPITLLSRFDLIFILRDIPNKEQDKRMARHILNLHLATTSSEKSPLDDKMLRKYISVAKRISPRITVEVVDHLERFYVKMREASIEGGEASAISITARQLESLIRIAEARARVHLREEVTVEDAEAAIILMQKSLEQVGIDVETGKIDIDILYTGKPRSLQLLLQKVLEIVGERERKEGFITDDDLYETLSTDHGIGRTEASRLIGILMRDGTIYSPRPGTYRRTV